MKIAAIEDAESASVATGCDAAPVPQFGKQEGAMRTLKVEWGRRSFEPCVR